jgi:hypothetical protein
LELSWIELRQLLEKIEREVDDPKKITIKRQHLREDKTKYDFNVRVHYRYNDYTILTAKVKAGVSYVQR